ncbi:PfkB family carbohydrate kinase [uncultured Tyzzerella sp.]|uniref:PfkB family carbohydrate kinase n=1 Tax=uncultured Tyzzerella sp. TaxID=2321398 RepID=UPI002942667C|nr:PfkB family carbohydrate kinase [uncultured Tyzzerella sp.]
MKKYDVIALGELLIDFTESGISPQGNQLFEANPGGAPCNVLAMLSKLGKKTAFIGKVGDDMFGRQLSDTVKSVGICTDGLVVDKSVPTTLAFVHTLAGGEREFSFIRNPGADMMLTEDEVNADLIKQSKIFHFGTLSSTHSDVRKATRFAIDTAIKSGALISFDPNLREPLWDNLDNAKTEIEYGFSKCNILKISDNEIEFTLGHNDYDKASNQLFEKYPNIQLIFITLGDNGSCAYTRNAKEKAPIYPAMTIEKTGAGDTFFGCALSFVLDNEISLFDDITLKKILQFANAGASLITTKKGALKVMPSKEDILEIIGSEKTN